MRAWRSALAALADRTGLEIHVSYVPAGTWRWNRIAHRWICREETEGAGRKESDELVLSLIGDGEVEEDRVIVYPDVPAWKSACGRGAGGPDTHRLSGNGRPAPRRRPQAGRRPRRRPESASPALMPAEKPIFRSHFVAEVDPS